MGKLVALSQVLLVVSVLGTGCGLVPGGGSETCVEWVRFEAPQDQYDQAGAVLIGKSVSTGGESYPEGDPLDTRQRIVIFATKQGGEWFTMTPSQGVLSFPQGTELPFH